MENLNFYILTGGPGSGKSTVLNLLFSMGYPVVPEVGRKIIQEQVSIKGNALPWGDTCRYAELMLLQSVLDFGKFASLNIPRFLTGVYPIPWDIVVLPVFRSEKVGICCPELSV